MSFPGGSSPAAMHIRAGWKLDGNSSKYVFMGEGSDQFIGRTVSLLNIYDCNEFSTLPPHTVVYLVQFFDRENRSVSQNRKFIQRFFLNFERFTM
jgi:hypothetical protein